MRDGAKVRLTDMEKSAVKTVMYAVLIDCARQRQLITYSDLAAQLPVHLHPHSFIFSHLLREVCGEALAHGDGQLCALVVSKSSGMPSGGYFTGTTSQHEQHPDLESRWQADLEALFERWQPGS